MVLDLQTVLGIIFGVGGVGAVTVLVTSYRRLKTGKISDEESIIKRLHRELQRTEVRADSAEEGSEYKTVMMQHWREQAWQYRLQLIAEDIEPKDLEVPEQHGH